MKHKFIKGDVVRNKYTERISLVTKIEGNCFYLSDPDCPSYGYTAYLTINPNYELIKHLSIKEYNNIINRKLI